MEKIVSLIANNGMGVVCLAFMMYYVNKFSTQNSNILVELKTTLQNISQTLSDFNNRLNAIENNLLEKRGK